MANFYGATGLTGGASGDLDNIDGNGLANADAAFVVTGIAAYLYFLNASSGAAESSPNVISPDSNAGNKRWILVDVVSEDILAELLKLYDTDKSHTLSLKWNENDTGDRVLNLLVNGADRSLTLTGNATLNQSVATGASPTFVTTLLSGLTASKPVFTNGSKQLVSTGTMPLAQGGTGATTKNTAQAALGLYSGASTFAGSVGATVTIGATLGGTSYYVAVTPTADSQDVGAIYITSKTITTFKVHCTGTGTPTFDWVLTDKN